MKSKSSKRHSTLSPVKQSAFWQSAFWGRSAVWFSGSGFLIMAILAQMLLRIGLFRLQFKGVNFFGEDSGVYYQVAKDLRPLESVWPKGWPWVLKGFLSISDSPLFLLVVQSLFGLAAQCLFIATAVKFGRRSLFLATILSIPFFYNPFWIRLNSLILMPDTISIFLVALTGFYGLKYFFEEESPVCGPTILSFLLGSIIFFKRILKVWSPLIFLMLLVRAVTHRKSKVVAILILSFFSGPLIYIFTVLHPTFGTYDPDTFSGFSIFDNLLASTNCNDLSASLPFIQKRAAFDQICTPELLNHPGWYQLWRPQGLIRVVSQNLFLSLTPIERNKIYQSWALNLMWMNPMTPIRAIWQNFSFYLSHDPPETLGFFKKPNLIGCEVPIKTFFQMDLSAYQQGASQFSLDRQGALKGVDWISAMGWYLMRLACIVLGFYIVVTTWRKVQKSLFFVVAAIIYGMAAFLGNSYEPRSYFILDFLLMTAVALLEIA